MSEVRDVPAAQRFELDEGGETAFAAYERDGDTIVFTHTVVPDAIGGRGVGTRLIAGALAAVRAAGLRVVPQCPFVAAFIEKHPDAADLVT